MSEMKRDSVLNYRPGTDSELPLEPGEKVSQVFLPDLRRYWMDHLVLGGLGAVLVSAVLVWLGKTEQIPVAILAILIGMAARAAWFRSEAFAKSKAKWTDRTGNARGSLSGTYTANISRDSARFEITISHGMPYGIWLELRWNGKFAIINKTVENQGKAFFDTANKVMAKMFGGIS